MRGIETGKVRIRHEVFTEIARMAYEGGDYAKRLEELPFKIIPGEIGSYRDSLFLERAVVGERLRLAMGLPLRKFSEFSLLSDGVEKALDPEIYYEKPLINVIKFACNRCPDNVVKITNVCQGCLEHPCMSVCPRQAITRQNGQAHIDPDKCIRCGRCLKECKFNAIVRLERPCRKACGMDCIHSDGLGRAGGTMTVLWTLFLFVTLTVIFAAYASRINLITARIFHIPATMLRRFVLAIRRALQGVMLGIVLVAIAQGVLCGIGFAVAGIKQPAFWGLLATVVAPIPFVGTALVWGPLCLSLWFSGATMPAVGLALWGTLAVTSVDNILRPLFLQQGINAPFFVLIIAILCGLGSFGPMGLIIGPVLLAIAMQAVEEAHQTYHHTA